MFEILDTSPTYFQDIPVGGLAVNISSQLVVRIEVVKKATGQSVNACIVDATVGAPVLVGELIWISATTPVRRVKLAAPIKLETV